MPRKKRQAMNQGSASSVEVEDVAEAEGDADEHEDEEEGERAAAADSRGQSGTSRHPRMVPAESSMVAHEAKRAACAAVKPSRVAR